MEFSLAMANDYGSKIRVFGRGFYRNDAPGGSVGGTEAVEIISAGDEHCAFVDSMGTFTHLVGMPASSWDTQEESRVLIPPKL